MEDAIAEHQIFRVKDDWLANGFTESMPELVEGGVRTVVAGFDLNGADALAAPGWLAEDCTWRVGVVVSGPYLGILDGLERGRNGLRGL